MSFHLSADNIHLVDDHILRASLRREDGEFQDAEIDLNSFIGNEDGMIHWDGRDFSHSATGASFHIEGGAGVPILRVFLRSRSGEDFARDVNLSERIGNNNGNFYYVE